MANFYLDIETTGLDPKQSKIVTIQYQKLDFDTKEARGPLVILKAWESSERDILEKFRKVFGEDTWGFVAYGYNLKFEHDFLFERSKICGFKYPIDLMSRPTVDLHPIGILMNNGNFKGSGLDKISGKIGSGKNCLEYYNNKEYEKIEAYIKQEAESYIKLLAWLRSRMPQLSVEFIEDCL